MVVGLVKNAVITVLKDNLWKLPVEFLEKCTARAIMRQHFGRLFASPMIPRREDVWDYVVQQVGPDRKVLYLEFGVHEGYSIAHFVRGFRAPGSRFCGFDSFEGLPETWGNKSAGHFSTQGAAPKSDDSRVEFVKGWFHRTLPGFAIDPGGYDAVVVHLDADLYSSTLFVLCQLWPRLDQFYAVFDEFTNHETRALYNFSQAFPCEIEFLAHDDGLPRRVFCRITRRQ